jgi:GT2 family glycosyltransferase
MKLSIICPVYNEIKFIENLLIFCLHANPKDKELIFIDGGSTDGTINIIKEYATKNNNIKLLNNPNKYVPFALNKAIPMATGDVLVRIDAHTDYADDYFEKIIETFKKTGADIVGGPMRIAEGTDFQNSVGFATSSVFGVGNSSFHFEGYEGYTDSVLYGAWKREIFSKTGLFDEKLFRNQDDEFHYRAKSMGFRIYQDPTIKLYYHPRNSFRSLFKQYYQYGLYKPLVINKIKSGLKLRHLIPAGFVLYLIINLVLNLFHIWYFNIFILIYLLIDIYFSFFHKAGLKSKILQFFIYPVLHFAYGIGFIFGLFKIF